MFIVALLVVVKTGRNLSDHELEHGEIHFHLVLQWNTTQQQKMDALQLHISL